MSARLLNRFAAWWLCCLAPIGAAWAGGVESAADAVPPDVDLFLAVDDAALWRRGPGEGFFETTVPMVFRGADLAGAWAGLAATLGLEEAHAFDALFGKRVVFVRRTAGDPKRRSWAILSHVSRATEQQVRTRIKPAARRVEKGQALLAIEDGRFWIATATGDAGAVLLLGPSDSPSLFNDLLPTLGRARKQSLASSKVGDDLRALSAGADALMVSRWRTANGRLVLLAVGARRRPEGASAAFLLRSESLAERLKAVVPTPRDAGDRLADGAWLAMVDWPLPGIVAELGGPDAESSVPLLFKQFPGRGLLGPRRAIVVGPTPTGRLSAVLAFETADVEALAAPADQLMASILMGLWAGPALPASRDTFDFDGRYFDAVREAPLPEPMLALAPALLDDSARLAWAFQPGEPRADKPTPGWWVVGVGPEAVRRVAGALSAPPEDNEQSPGVNVGTASPADLARLLDRSNLPLPGPLGDLAGALRHVRSGDWAFGRGDGGSLRGTISLLFAAGAR